MKKRTVARRRKPTGLTRLLTKHRKCKRAFPSRAWARTVSTAVYVAEYFRVNESYLYVKFVHC